MMAAREGLGLAVDVRDAWAVVPRCWTMEGQGSWVEVESRSSLLYIILPQSHHNLFPGGHDPSYSLSALSNSCPDQKKSDYVSHSESSFLHLSSYIAT